MIEHSLSALYNIPHGAGLSVVIPGWLEWYRDHDEARIAQLGRQIFPPPDLQPYTDAEIAERTIIIFKNWFGRTESPVSLEELAIPVTDIPMIAKNALSLAKVWRLNDYSQETIEEILHICR
jgi:alcohol dehydrogenase YqhD (iron-dependent ADH family)